MADFKFKPGDEVMITGKIYQSANGTLTGKTLKRYKGTVKKIAEKAAHPYAIEEMWGWFNENELKPYVAPPKFEIGDKVKLIKNITYSGNKFVPKRDIYELLKVEDDKAYIGINGVQSSIVSIFNLKKA